MKAFKRLIYATENGFRRLQFLQPQKTGLSALNNYANELDWLLFRSPRLSVLLAYTLPVASIKSSKNGHNVV